MKKASCCSASCFFAYDEERKDECTGEVEFVTEDWDDDAEDYSDLHACEAHYEEIRNLR